MPAFRYPAMLNRRRFLASLVVSAVVLALPGCRASGNAPAGRIEIDRRRFPQSVASGDPRPDTLMLWTRLASAHPVDTVTLQLAADATFEGTVVEHLLQCQREHDHCLRVRVTGLQPGQTLYYRFLVRDDDDGWRSSPVGRTRTAPAADADLAQRFAFMSCQDYGGRWYNSLLPLLDEDLDFIVHLGDFVYETVGDPGFQSRDGERRIQFDDSAGAIRLGSDEAPFHAARSLDNYRQLHRTVRTDPTLQALLEKAPLIAIWDDHEFADDCWQDHATQHDGRRDEADAERRRNAEQAYLEYLPLDVDPALADDAHVDRQSLFPQLRIWRRLRFGRHVELFLTDTRSERPDHLVPEDAFPGTVLYDEAELRERLPALGIDPDTLAGVLVPWIDLSAPARDGLRSVLQSLLTVACNTEGLDATAAFAYAHAACQGRIALPVLNALLDRWNAQAPESLRSPTIDAAEAEGRGLAWLSLGKTALFSSLGSRYMVVADAFAALAALRHDGSHNPMSPTQWQWLGDSLRDSDAGWKIVASSISLSPIVLDLANPILQAPEPMRHRFLLNVDHWDGFPASRQALIDELFAPAGNVVAISGDIHAAFVSQHGARAVEFTVPAVSSTTLSDILAAEVARNPATADAGQRLVAGFNALIAAGTGQIRHVDTTRHGVCVAQVDGDGFRVDLLSLPSPACCENLYDQPERLGALLQRQRFVVDAASGQVAPAATPEA